MAYYVGLDVSVKETSICIMDDKGDLTPPRSITTKRKTIRPSPLSGTNAVSGNGSCIAQKLGFG